MELRQIDRILLKILYLVTAGIIVTQVFRQRDFTSFLFYLTFPLTFMIWIRSVKKAFTAEDVVVMFTCALAVINVLLNAGMTNTIISFEYLKKLIMFITTLLFLQASFRMKINGEMGRFIINIADFLTLFFIGSYFVFGSKMYYLNDRPSRYLTFLFDNPNLTGLFLVCLYILELYRLFSPEKRLHKLLHIIMSAFLVWFIISTQSRNSILVMVLVTVICAWLLFRGKRKLRIGKFLSVIIVSFPITFVAAYMILIYMPWIQRIFEFFTGEGKSLLSRVTIWNEALKYAWDSPLIGAYSQISEGTGISQMHNSHLDIWCSYGILVLILVCWLLYKYVNQKGKVYSGKENFIYILGFSCAIMLGLGEAALFSGGLGVYVFVGTFLLMAEKSEEKS